MKEEVACKVAMLMCEACTIGESGVGKATLLIAVVQKMGHPSFNIEDHLAKHTIGPAEPAIVVSPGYDKNKRDDIELTMTE